MDQDMAYIWRIYPMCPVTGLHVIPTSNLSLVEAMEDQSGYRRASKEVEKFDYVHPASKGPPGV